MLFFVLFAEQIVFIICLFKQCLDLSVLNQVQIISYSISGDNTFCRDKRNCFLIYHVIILYYVFSKTVYIVEA